MGSSERWGREEGKNERRRGSGGEKKGVRKGGEKMGFREEEGCEEGVRRKLRKERRGPGGE